MTLNTLRLLLSNSNGLLVFCINPLFLTDSLFFSQSLLLLLVGNSPLFSFDALLLFNLLLSFLFLLFQLLGLLSRVVVITVG